MRSYVEVASPSFCRYMASCRPSSLEQ